VLFLISQLRGHPLVTAVLDAAVYASPDASLGLERRKAETRMVPLNVP